MAEWPAGLARRENTGGATLPASAAGAPRESGSGARTACRWPASGRSGRGGSRPGGRRAAARGGISGLFEPAAGRGPPGRPCRGSGGWWTCPPPGLPLRTNPVALLAAAAWAGLLCYPASLLPGLAGALVLAVLAAAALTAGAGAGSRSRAGWPSPPRRPSTARSSPAGSSGAAAGTTNPRPLLRGGRWAAGLERGYQPRRVLAGCRWGPGPGPGLPPVREAARPGHARRRPSRAGPRGASRGYGPGPPPGAAAAGTGLPSGSLLLTPGEGRRCWAARSGRSRSHPVRCRGDLPARWRDGDRDGGRRPARRGQCGPARQVGRPLGGVGDEAWLLNHDRTAVVRVAGLTAKITFIGRRARPAACSPRWPRPWPRAWPITSRGHERHGRRGGQAGLSGGTGGRSGDLVRRERAAQHVEVGCVRSGCEDFGMAVIPCSRCQRSTTWAGVTPCFPAIPVTPGYPGPDLQTL